MLGDSPCVRCMDNSAHRLEQVDQRRLWGSRRRDSHVADVPSPTRIETPARGRGGCSRMAERWPGAIPWGGRSGRRLRPPPPCARPTAPAPAPQGKAVFVCAFFREVQPGRQISAFLLCVFWKKALIWSKKARLSLWSHLQLGDFELGQAVPHCLDPHPICRRRRRRRLLILVVACSGRRLGHGERPHLGVQLGTAAEWEGAAVAPQPRPRCFSRYKEPR